MNELANITTEDLASADFIPSRASLDNPSHPPQRAWEGQPFWVLWSDADAPPYFGLRAWGIAALVAVVVIIGVRLT